MSCESAGSNVASRTGSSGSTACASGAPKWRGNTWADCATTRPENARNNVKNTNRRRNEISPRRGVGLALENDLKSAASQRALSGNIDKTHTIAKVGTKYDGLDHQGENGESFQSRRLRKRNDDA